MISYKTKLKDISTTNIGNKIGLVLLATRREFADVIFVYKLFNGMVDYLEFLSQICFGFLASKSRIKFIFHILTVLGIT